MADAEQRYRQIKKQTLRNREREKENDNEEEKQTKRE